MKHIVCYSGGHDSGVVGVEVSRRFGKENTILLNHDIHESVEDADIKRFKQEVADYLEIPITFANMLGVEHMDQFDVCMREGGFKFGNGYAACTRIMKTEPFHAYLAEEFPTSEGVTREDVKVYYGYGTTTKERERIVRRTGVLGNMGYRTDYPVALWRERTIWKIEEVGIQRPLTYSVRTHGNCWGCLKGGKQHWYVTYVHRPDVFAKGKLAEEVIGYSILKGVYLEELEEEFAFLHAAGVAATEHMAPAKFWAQANRILGRRQILKMAFDEADLLPCECVI